MATKACGHCGAEAAGLFANDGSVVCERCFAYDQVVKGELRVSQQDLGFVGTGEVERLEQQARSTGLQELVVTLAALGAAAACAYAAEGGQPLGWLGVFVFGSVGLFVGSRAIRTLRFATREAPVIVKKASLPPPPMPGKPAGS